MFADEPTGNLDSKSGAARCSSCCASSVDELGQTVVMVTHDASAAAVADRVVVLADGQIVHDGAAGTADEVHDLMRTAADARRRSAGIAARKLRTALTAFAVVLGVALMSGTYLFTDTINSTFDTIFQTANKGVDVAVTPHETFGTDDRSTHAGAARPSVLARSGRSPASRVAAGDVFDAGGPRTRTATGSATAARRSSSLGVSPPRFRPFKLRGGPRCPRTADEVAIDQTHADARASSSATRCGVGQGAAQGLPARRRHADRRRRTRSAARRSRS